MNVEVPLITYYLTSDDSIAWEYKGLTSSYKDRNWLKARGGNRVIYPSYKPMVWREMKASGFDGVIAIDIPFSAVPDSVRLKLPKEIQMQILIGAV